MVKRLASALLLAVLAGAVTFVAGSMLKRGGEAEAAEPLADDADVPAGDGRHIITLVRPIYLQPNGDGPRIIRVPQPEDHAAIAPEPDDRELDPPPRPQRKPQSQQPASKPRAATPRWPAQRSEPAPPPVRPRAVLNAPNPIHDGPTPIRPLPRFAGTPAGEKFAAPDPTASVPGAAAIAPPPVEEHVTDTPPDGPDEPDAN